MKNFRVIALRLFVIFFLVVSAFSICGAVSQVGSPENPFVLTSTTPTFHWENVPGADLYALYVSRYPY